ncbi:hypothetical protein WMY93_026460 [Mugilogobius chulae]|uniref:Uncharacterized protein n=1 Tax=Mugilogobius chulae TaxID=88201 RepID=A0AAW0MZ45_9GOBI
MEKWHYVIGQDTPLSLHSVILLVVVEGVKAADLMPFSYRADKPIGLTAFNVRAQTCLSALNAAACLRFSLSLVELGYVDHAEELASRFLQCFPKNRLSAQAALQHEYFSNMPPRLWELQDMSSIFTVPNVKLQTESGDSIQVCARRNSHGKAPSSTKH